MATEAKTEGFTPGPWEIRFQFNVFSGNRLVANAGGYSNNWDSRGVERENVANAHLIAAAPDLYAACKALFGFFDTDPYGCAYCGTKCSKDWDEKTPKDCKHAANCPFVGAAAALRKAGGAA